MVRSPRIGWAGLAIGLLLAVPGAAQAATFDVTTTDDHAVGACDASDCTLREAVVAANANGNAGVTDEISLPAGTHAITDKPAAGDSAAVTDLDVTEPLRITGPGASTTTIDASQLTGAQAVIQADPNANTIELVDVTITGGDAAGIQDAPGVSLTLTRSAVVGNSGSASGGGIDAGSGVSLTVTDTTVSGNSASNGAGIYVDGPNATVTNSTISGNQASSEGGGVYVEIGTLDFVNSTVAFNTAPSGAGITNYDEMTLKNTIVSDNTGGGNNCDGLAPVMSQGNNIEDTDTCSLNASGDKPSTDPGLAPLTNNGGTTQTHALGGTSPAVNAAGSCPPPSADQRGTPRPQGAACDMGAYELVTSRTVPTVPDCSPTGAIPLDMNVPGETPVAFHYKLDGGPTQDVPTSDETATINLPEGRFGIEYWSETAESGEEPQSQHQVGTALIDKTAPDLSVANDQELSIFVITRNATVTVAAGDPGAEPSGLTSNPTAASEPVSTDSRGDKTVEWTAVDLCENGTTKTFDYTVLGPGLGERAVIEPLGEDVEVQLPDGGGARVSQKGADFQPVPVPREIPVGTIIDARDGEARITSSKSTTETDIQDGEFVAGVFKVLQSRKESRKGLTTLRLRKGNFNKCQEGKGASAALSRRAIRRLRARARGRFRTRSRYSAATVRGTKWTVTDRCDGTLTEVRRGKVAVRDFRLQETIVLKRGEKYLARAEPPPPALGETVNVEQVKGKVFVKLPRKGEFARASQKGTDFVPLTSERSIPVRSILDTRRGTVALRSAQNRKGRIQSGKFADGVFQVLQSRKRREKGLTTLRMKGSAAKFKRCGKGSSATAAPDAQASLTRRQIRRLRARARGRYRTRSRYSAATVRGTVWTATDRCDGTLTAVKRGKVAVRDFRRKRTITLTAGKSYLAGAR